MRRLVLRESVQIAGPSPITFGLLPRQHMIEIRPLSVSDLRKTPNKDGRGVFWQTLTGPLVPIDMSLVRGADEMPAEDVPSIALDQNHFLYFKYGKERLNCVEHLLALKAFGLDGVVIRALHSSTWVPYDGRAKIFWEELEDKLKIDGNLAPMTMAVDYSLEDKHPKFGWTRSTSLDSTEKRNALSISATIDYSMFGGKQTIKQTFPDDITSELTNILCARGLLQPPWLEKRVPFLRALGWPHAENFLMPSAYAENPQKFMAELLRHRLLDALGCLGLMAEAGTCLVGTINLDKGNHATDLSFLKALKPIAHKKHPGLSCLALHQA